MQKTLFLKLSTDLSDKSIELALSVSDEESNKEVLSLSEELFNLSKEIIDLSFGKEKFNTPKFDVIKSLAEKKGVKVGHSSTIVKEIQNLLFNDKYCISKVKKIYLDTSEVVVFSGKLIKKIESFDKKLQSVLDVK
jgi:ABC-type uncharacterized transport system substrate-binding protein